MQDDCCQLLEACSRARCMSTQMPSRLHACMQARMTQCLCGPSGLCWHACMHADLYGPVPLWALCALQLHPWLLPRMLCCASQHMPLAWSTAVTVAIGVVFERWHACPASPMTAHAMLIACACEDMHEPFLERENIESWDI